MKRPMDYSLGAVCLIKEADASDDSLPMEHSEDKKNVKSWFSADRTSSVTLPDLHSELTKYFSVLDKPIKTESLTNELDGSALHKFETEFDGSHSDILPVSPQQTLELDMLKSPKRDDKIKKSITSKKKAQPEFVDGLFKIRSCHEQFLKKHIEVKRSRLISQQNTDNPVRPTPAYN
jgi:hypothetical protein